MDQRRPPLVYRLQARLAVYGATGRSPGAQALGVEHGSALGKLLNSSKPPVLTCEMDMTPLTSWSFLRKNVE